MNEFTITENITIIQERCCQKEKIVAINEVDYFFKSCIFWESVQNPSFLLPKLSVQLRVAEKTRNFVSWFSFGLLL